MKKKNRRDFLTQTFKGAVIAALSLVPGSLFNPRFSFAKKKSSSTEEDTLENVLKRVTKANLYPELNTAKLSPEEKLAIVSVKEIKRSEISEILEKIDKGGRVAAGLGCGNICGVGCGWICGNGCLEATDVIGIVDRKGLLDINIDKIEKPKFLDALKLARRINR